MMEKLYLLSLFFFSPLSLQNGRLKVDYLNSPMDVENLVYSDFNLFFIDRNLSTYSSFMLYTMIILIGYGLFLYNHHPRYIFNKN